MIGIGEFSLKTSLASVSVASYTSAQPQLTVQAPTMPLEFPRSSSIDEPHTDVARLQKDLIQYGYLSSGNDTGFFGPRTEAALQQFQCDEQIVCEGDTLSTGWGAFGPITQGVLSEMIINADESPRTAILESNLEALKIQLATLRQDAS
ncbi:MAG: peptidoglycan-binding protein [Candidatus Sungbacteria bacterium]|uniref:Peptidoglycan-binding protein n=1 Tax=Candidatus Sungiibacteriota bacterium TaxID=2750080 RepID=A0A9D6LTP1_9BACT|nr:peptidoglycan-binding protein [Candidatus Sungbacteria bacterium]